MKQQQFLGLLTVCTMLFGLAGCQGDTESIETEAFITEQTTQSADVTVEESIPENEDKDGNGEADIIRSCLYVDGKQVTLPCTLAEFGEGFKIRDEGTEDNSPQLVDNEYGFDEAGNAIPAYQGILRYDDISWGTVTYTISDNGEQVIWSVLIVAWYWYDDNDYSRIKVNNEAYIGGDYRDLTEIKGISYDYDTDLGSIICSASDNTYDTKLAISIKEDNTVGMINVTVHPKK